MTNTIGMVEVAAFGEGPHPCPLCAVNRFTTIEFINYFWARRDRSPAGEGFVYEGNDCPRIFLGAPTGTRVGHANSRCSGEVETSNASNASDPLQEDRGRLADRRL